MKQDDVEYCPFIGDCFLCGADATSTDWDDVNDPTGYRCTNCSFIDAAAASDKINDWWVDLMDRVGKRNRARLALKELMND